MKGKTDMKVNEAYDAIAEFSEKSMHPERFDFDETRRLLDKVMEALKEYPQTAKFVDMEFIRDLQNDYCSKLVISYSQIFKLLMKTKTLDEQKNYLRGFKNINPALLANFEDIAIKENPDLIDDVFNAHLKSILTESEDKNANRSVMSVILAAPTAEKCEQLLNLAFDLKVPEICRNKNLPFIEETYQKFPQLIDTVFTHIKNCKNSPYYFAALADVALFDEYKAEEALCEMHARVQKGPIDEFSLQKYYEKMKLVTDSLPKFKPLVREFCREALLLKQNNNDCLKAAARLLGDENALRSQVEIGKEIKKSKKNIFGYQKVDKVDSDETCILFIGGNGTLTDKAAHGYLKSAISLLKQHHLSKNVTVYGATYDFGDYFNTKQALDAQMKKYGHKPLHRAEDLKNIHADTENPQFIKQIFDKFILPRISTLDGKVKIPATEAAKKMNKLKIVAHCFGGYASLKLEEMSLQKMSELGYTQKEKETIQGQLQILAMNPYCPLGVQKSEMFSVISAQDREVTHNNYFEKYIRKMVSKGKTVPLSYFKKDLGNFVLVNRMYGSDNRVVTQTDDGEHSYFGFSILPAHSENAKIAMTFAQNYLINGIKSALKNEVRQKNITQLVAQNKIDAINFAKAGENGRILYNEIITQTLAENDAIFKKKVLTNKKE